MDSIRPGRTLNGKWTLGARLASGGDFLLYEAFHRNGIRAAAKILRPEASADEARVERFLDEERARTHEEGLGRVAAFDDDRSGDGLVYVVFERIDASPPDRTPRPLARQPVASSPRATEQDARPPQAPPDESVRRTAPPPPKRALRLIALAALAAAALVCLSWLAYAAAQSEPQRQPSQAGVRRD